MFVLLLTYVRPLDEVDRLRDAHMRWLDGHYADGRFVASGPQVPRTGGVILAHGDDRAEMERLVADDPFASEGVAHYDLVQFTPSTVAQGVRGVLGG